jgi:hypothetical protein
MARGYALAAVADPLAFLGYAAVFPPELQTSARFRAAFSESYRRIAEYGPLAAMDPEAERERAGGTR